MKRKFETNSARVKGVCFHPSRPWVITSLHSGVIQIWDYQMKILIANFDEHSGPVRGIDFHPHLPLFVSGGDDADVRVWNYKHKRCNFILKGHIDYIRTTYFHHELPWILSASDDQTIRIWNYQSRNCVNIITGHSHYVMCAQFHHEKDLLVSASLDSTIRIWDYSILRKKLTETKNNSSFIGIEIECIKILQGHQRGANWVCFHPSQNIIASGSDDRKIILWKYTNQVAWQHSTILGHKSNVSCILFDNLTHNLISNSQDRTTRVWNIESKTEIQIYKKEHKERYWILAQKKNGTLLASGHDEGLDIFQLNKQRVPHVKISDSLVVFAQGMSTFLYDVAAKKEKMELYQYKPKDKNAVVLIDKIIGNHFDSSVYMVQIDELGLKFYMIKKKQAYLNFPTVYKDYSALDSCFIAKDKIAMLTTPQQIQYTSFTNSSQKIKILNMKSESEICRIHHSNNPMEIIYVTKNDGLVWKFNLETKKTVGQQKIQDTDLRGIVFGFKKMAIVSRSSIMIAKDTLQKIVTIRQSFPIKSAFWESDKLLFYTTINHLKYAFLNGQTGVLKTLEEPLHLIMKQSGNKFIAFNERQKVFQIEFPDYSELEFRMAINDKNWDRVKEILATMGESKKKILIKCLVSKGYPQYAMNLVSKPQQMFALAIQSSDFKKALEICTKVNTQQSWKMFGEEALKQGIYEAYELSCHKLKNWDELNFLYSLQANTDKLQKMLKSSKKMNNPILEYNTNLFLNNREGFQTILRDAGMVSLAELCSEADKDQSEQCDILRKLGSRPLTPCEPVGGDNCANWPHNVEQEDEDEEDEESEGDED